MNHVKKTLFFSFLVALFCSATTQVQGHIGFGVDFGGPCYHSRPRYYTGFHYGPTWGPCHSDHCSDGDVAAAGALGLIGGLAAGAALSNTNHYKSAEELKIESEYALKMRELREEQAEKDHQARLERKRKRLECIAERKKARIKTKAKRRKEHEELQGLNKTSIE